MNRRTLHIVILLVIACPQIRAADGAAAADVPNANAGAITGTITGADGKPAGGREINLFSSKPDPADGGRNRTPKPIATVQTNDKGQYTFSNIAPGAYRMVAGIPFKEMAIANVTVKAGGKLTVNLTLKARKVY